MSKRTSEAPVKSLHCYYYDYDYYDYDYYEYDHYDYQSSPTPLPLRYNTFIALQKKSPKDLDDL